MVSFHGYFPGVVDVTDDPARLELVVPALADNVPLVRHALRGFLDANGVSDPPASDVLLAVTEACTNVVQHAYPNAAPGEVELAAECVYGALTVAVRDHGGGFTARIDSPGLGLGLPVIAAVAESMEIRPGPADGTEVVMSFSTGSAA